jgi:2'-5' RNA ligase
MTGQVDALTGARDGQAPLVGVILGFPDEVADEIRGWRASFGDPMAGVIPAHITLVTTTESEDWGATVSHVRRVASQQAPFRVTISGTGSFRPVSEGFDECVRLHAELQRGPLQRELPFPYHPHVTVAHDVESERLDAAEEALKNYSTSFTVASMGLYEHDADGLWQLREELDFGGTATDQDSREDEA